MAHVKVAGRIRIHRQEVILRARVIVAHAVEILVFPALLPLRLDRLWVVLFGHSASPPSGRESHFPSSACSKIRKPPIRRRKGGRSKHPHDARGVFICGRAGRRDSDGAEGIRTPYLNTASVALSQLSYSPSFEPEHADPNPGLAKRQIKTSAYGSGGWSVDTTSDLMDNKFNGSRMNRSLCPLWCPVVWPAAIST